MPEVEKPAAEKGLFLHPSEYHQPPEKGLNFQHLPKPAAATPQDQPAGSVASK